jgi:hypothetical protein
MEDDAEKHGSIHGLRRKFLFMKYLQKPPWMPVPDRGLGVEA